MGSHSVTCHQAKVILPTLFWFSPVLILPSLKMWKAESTSVKVHNQCPRLYIAVVVVINTGPWWASILGPHTSQSSTLPLDHCDMQSTIFLY